MAIINIKLSMVLYLPMNCKDEQEKPLSGLQIRACTGKLFSSFLVQNICFGYSKELSQ